MGKRARLLTWTIRLILWTLGFTRIIRTVIIGAEVVPRRRAVLLPANHSSMIDVFVILGGEVQRRITNSRCRSAEPDVHRRQSEDLLAGRLCADQQHSAAGFRVQ